MTFLRWLKYKVVKISALGAALASFLGGIYFLFFIPDFNLRIAGIVVGTMVGIGFLLLNHYYSLKIMNLYFLPGGSAAIQARNKKGNMMPRHMMKKDDMPEDEEE